MNASDDYSDFATEYDSLIERFQSYTDAAVFGLMYDHVRPGESVLDIGVGTGLASERLARYGLDVYGVDASQAMLKQCEAKGIAKELKLVDVNEGALTYKSEFFDHCLTCGVLHFFEDLSHVFGEAARLLRDGGTFTFTIMSDKDGGAEDRTVTRRPTRWGTDVFHHGRGYVLDLCQRSGLKPVSWILVLGDVDPEGGGKNYYWIYVTRKVGAG